MKRVTLGAVLRECKRRGISFADNTNAYIDKMTNLVEEAWADFYDLRQESFEGAGSRMDKENPLRYSPEATKVKMLIEDIYKKTGELKKAVNLLKKFKK